MKLIATFVGIFKHVERGSGGRHDDGGRGDIFGFVSGGIYCRGEIAGNSETVVWEYSSESAARFADKDDFFDLGGREGLAELGKVFVVSLVASADDEDEIVVRKGFNCDSSGSRISGEIVVVIFDTINLADKLEAMREP